MKPKHTKIHKVLIANRGEIARRIQRACHKLAIKTVSVASEADQEARFAREADELVVLGPAAPKDSYLAVEKIIKAARDTGCDAVHPGYGFLSENSAFAQAVIDAGLIFIGPSPKSIAALGSKTQAKALARSAKVPCAPSSEAGLSDDALIAAARKIGYPVLIKAVAGGGGRGMREARSDDELRAAIPRARGEALKFFANEDIYLEKLVEQPRHVEVQILGDQHGNLIHLGTRDCSMQRRHQKLIEEAPAPKLAPELRERIHQAALSAAKAAGYYNAGTVEFLVKGEEFYFLEVNTRIQVEHPVTEAITGLDLVELQLRIAQGEKLPISQEDVRFTGHAIEFRICAEDPWNGFRPATGTLSKIVAPQAPFCREDTGVEEGDAVSLHYDSLLSKIVILGASRGDAIDKSLEYLRSYAIEGVFCTIDLHLWALYNGLFRSGPVDIGYLEREFSVSSLLGLRAAAVRDPEWQKPIGAGSFKNHPVETSAKKGAAMNNAFGEQSSDITPVGKGAAVKNVYKYQSEKYKTTYTIEVLHKRDGFFVAVPVDSAGRRGKSNNCRMSNGLNTVMSTLINDVLEKTPPSEIF